MCECAKVHLFEVEFKLAGMTVVPTHKNCGDPLNEKQAEEKLLNEKLNEDAKKKYINNKKNNKQLSNRVNTLNIS